MYRASIRNLRELAFSCQRDTNTRVRAQRTILGIGKATQMDVLQVATKAVSCGEAILAVRCMVERNYPASIFREVVKKCQHADAVKIAKQHLS
jgi:hypothetical protein